MNNTVLAFQDVSKSYTQDTPILQSAHMRIDKGEVVALVGASGCGKSTVLQCAGLLDTIDNGHIWIDGVDMTHAHDTLRTHTRRHKVGVIYQFHNLLTEFNVLENVAYPLWLQGTSHKKSRLLARDVLDRVGMADFADAKVQTLSGGQAQRVAIARCLSGNPTLILADEPTGNLDTENSHIVWDVLVDMVRHNNTAMLCVTHDTQLAKSADTVLTIHDKKIIS